MKTRTFDLHTVRISGKPVLYFDNKYDIKIGLDIGCENLLMVSVGKDQDKRTNKKVAPFTEKEFKDSKSVTITEAKFKNWVNKQGQTQYELKTYGKKVLLDVPTKTNDAFIGGVVSAVSSNQGKFIIETPYMKFRGGKGKKPEYDNRLARVSTTQDLPSIGKEVIVQGTLSVTSTKTIDIISDTWTEI